MINEKSAEITVRRSTLADLASDRNVSVWKVRQWIKAGMPADHLGARTVRVNLERGAAVAGPAGRCLVMDEATREQVKRLKEKRQVVKAAYWATQERIKELKVEASALGKELQRLQGESGRLRAKLAAIHESGRDNNLNQLDVLQRAYAYLQKHRDLPDVEELLEEIEDVVDAPTGGAS